MTLKAIKALIPPGTTERAVVVVNTSQLPYVWSIGWSKPASAPNVASIEWGLLEGNARIGDLKYAYLSKIEVFLEKDRNGKFGFSYRRRIGWWERTSLSWFGNSASPKGSSSTAGSSRSA